MIKLGRQKINLGVNVIYQKKKKRTTLQRCRRQNIKVLYFWLVDFQKNSLVPLHLLATLEGTLLKLSICNVVREFHIWFSLRELPSYLMSGVLAQNDDLQPSLL